MIRAIHVITEKTSPHFLLVLYSCGFDEKNSDEIKLLTIEKLVNWALVKWGISILNMCCYDNVGDSDDDRAYAVLINKNWNSGF
jgi:hypothetical protein